MLVLSAGVLAALGGAGAPRHAVKEVTSCPRILILPRTVGRGGGLVAGVELSHVVDLSPGGVGLLVLETQVGEGTLKAAEIA